MCSNWGGTPQPQFILIYTTVNAYAQNRYIFDEDYDELYCLAYTYRSGGGAVGLQAMLDHITLASGTKTIVKTLKDISDSKSAIIKLTNVKINDSIQFYGSSGECQQFIMTDSNIFPDSVDLFVG